MQGSRYLSAAVPTAPQLFHLRAEMGSATGAVPTAPQLFHLRAAPPRGLDSQSSTATSQRTSACRSNVRSSSARVPRARLRPWPRALNIGRSLVDLRARLRRRRLGRWPRRTERGCANEKCSQHAQENARESAQKFALAERASARCEHVDLPDSSNAGRRHVTSSSAEPRAIAQKKGAASLHANFAAKDQGTSRFAFSVARRVGVGTSLRHASTDQ